VANEAESKRWNNDRWAAAWPQREKLTDAVSPQLLQAVEARAGQRVCDVGCGGGGLTIALARAVGTAGEAVGIDLSAPLLELARSRATEGGVANARFILMDVQTGALEEVPFDLAVSQFGVMFFDEPLVAFSAIRGVLVPGGRLVFTCWQGVEQNPWHVRTALRSLLPSPPVPPPGRSPVGPFVLGDDEYTREVLESAGFTAVESTAHEITVRAPANAVFDRSSFELFGVPPGREDEALSRIDRCLEQFAVGPDEYEYPLAFRIVQAVNPEGDRLVC
jgi:SAM-dependent methyltransferase